MATARWCIRTLDGERVIRRGTDDYMTAQDTAAHIAYATESSVYLWWGDRAPVRIDSPEGK